MNTTYTFHFEEARERIKEGLQPTRLLPSPFFSNRTGNSVYLKPENLQNTGSFKIRGAYNKISKLSEEEKKLGLITASAGNHAQGVAYAASKLGVKATICMPKTTPLIKVDRTKAYGVDVVLSGSTYDEAYEKCLELQKEHGYTLVHPFDDYDVMEGQGTIALEILKELPDADILLVPVGGGGLISGVARCAKELRPDIEIIGVESDTVPSMQKAVAAGVCCPLTESGATIADGTAVRNPGHLTFEICKDYVDRWICVTDFELMSCFADVVAQHKIIVEPSGLLSIAASKHLNAEGKKVVCILSGGNIDMLTISDMVTKGLVNQGRIFTFDLNVPNRPGSLIKVLDVLARERANVVKVEHDRYRTAGHYEDIGLDISIETNGYQHIEQVKNALRDAGFVINRSSNLGSLT